MRYFTVQERICKSLLKHGSLQAAKLSRLINRTTAKERDTAISELVYYGKIEIVQIQQGSTTGRNPRFYQLTSEGIHWIESMIYNK